MNAPDQPVLETLAARLGEQLRLAGHTLATAESCTGGWLSQCLTAIPGSSAWYDRGFITYSYAAKTELLGVPSELIMSRGAVSEAVALAMAEGALARSQANWSVAITGIAGPDGGTPEKPVGTVCFAWMGSDGSRRVTTLHLAGDRTSIRAQAVATALHGLIECSEQTFA